MAIADALDPDNNRWHWLAVDLRVWREMKGESQRAVGDHCGVTAPLVSMWESASAKIPREHAETLDRIWGTRRHFVRLWDLANSGHDGDWYDRYTKHEKVATTISTYSALTVPALLQTPDYARALLEGAGMVEDVEAALAERLARQELLHREDPPALWFLIYQPVLEAPIGGPEVMRAQLAHLHEMSHRRRLRLCVVPTDTGAHAGVDGSFIVLTCPDADHAWSSAVSGGRLVSDPAKVKEYRVRYDLIGVDALTRGSTRSLITDLMEGKR